MSICETLLNPEMIEKQNPTQLVIIHFFYLFVGY